MLSPRYIDPFRVTARVGKLAYRLEVPANWSHILNTFNVSQLKKCVADETEVFPLEKIQVDDRLDYIERLTAILDHKVKFLRNKEVSLVQVQWQHRGDPSELGSRSLRCVSSAPSCFQKTTSRAKSDSSGGEL